MRCQGKKTPDTAAEHGVLADLLAAGNQECKLMILDALGL